MTVQSWNLPAPPGFQGLREDLPLTMYMRHLPHWRQRGATYFVTFRLGDSLPQCKLDELAAVRREWERGHSVNQKQQPSKESLETLAHTLTAHQERWLDEGHGACHLERLELAQIVADSLLHFDNERYALNSFVIMPNHVHAILRPLDQHELEDIVKSWKQFTARRIQAQLDTPGAMWQEESFDRIIRDEEHLYRCLQYIGSNPAKAGRTRAACLCWVRPEWAQLGWDFLPELSLTGFLARQGESKPLQNGTRIF